MKSLDCRLINSWNHLPRLKSASLDIEQRFIDGKPSAICICAESVCIDLNKLVWLYSQLSLTRQPQNQLGVLSITIRLNLEQKNWIGGYLRAMCNSYQMSQRLLLEL